MVGGIGAFWGTKTDGDSEAARLRRPVWKRFKLTSTRKANAKKRLHRVRQNETVLRACAEPTSSKLVGL